MTETKQPVDINFSYSEGCEKAIKVFDEIPKNGEIEVTYGYMQIL